MRTTEAFPILGGRLLKNNNVYRIPIFEEFPILGGRLLKRANKMVPWKIGNVSNPWREAIEAMNRINVRLTTESFQSLEGGY